MRGSFRNRDNTQAQCSSLTFYLFLLYFIYDIWIEWTSYANCSQPVNYWMIGQIFMFYVLRLLIVKMYESDDDFESLNRVLIFAYFPVFVFLTGLGMSWYLEVLHQPEGTCLSEETLWVFIFWILLSWMIVMAFTSLLLLSLFQKLKDCNPQVFDDEIYSQQDLQIIRRHQRLQLQLPEAEDDGLTNEEKEKIPARNFDSLQQQLMYEDEEMTTQSQGGSWDQVVRLMSNKKGTPRNRSSTSRQTTDSSVHRSIDQLADVCSICYFDYQRGHKIRIMPLCGHQFHQECIDSWLSFKGRCPMCNRNTRESLAQHHKHLSAFNI